MSGCRSIARLILGPMDSVVELVFEVKDTVPAERKTVTLVRGVQLVENQSAEPAAPAPTSSAAGSADGRMRTASTGSSTTSTFRIAGSDGGPDVEYTI
jgi:hypothetical protein